MKIIEITVSPRGETKVETRGFTGGACREASRFIEQALGAAHGRGAHRRVPPGPIGRPGREAVDLIPPRPRSDRRPSLPLPRTSTLESRRTFMTLAERLSEYVRACFTGVWIRTFEPDDALAEIARLCRQNRWTLAAWDIDRGLSLAGQTAESGTVASAADPLAAIRALGAPGRARRHGLARAQELPPVPGLGRGRSGARFPARRGQAGAHLRRRPGAPGPDPHRAGEASSLSSSTTCPIATSSSGSPAASPPSPATCPRTPPRWIVSSTRRRV